MKKTIKIVVSLVFVFLPIIIALGIPPENASLEPEDKIRDFDGFRVYRLNASTKSQFDSLVRLHDEGEFDFWQTPRLHTFTDIMVSKQQEDKLLELVKQQNIQYTVMINNVAKIISEQQTMKKTAKEPEEMDWSQYHSFETIYRWMEDLEKGFPHLAQLLTIGKSTEGIPLKLMKISLGDRPNKPGVFIDGSAILDNIAFHAREWISPAVATYILKELVVNAEKHSYLLEEYDFYILPIVNPDGYQYSMNVNRLWRKTRVSGPKTFFESLIGCRGVDLNRNFGYMFGGDGSSSSACSLTYRGPQAFSEPESAAIRDFVMNTRQDWRFYLSLHSYGQKWLTPWAYTAELPEDYEELERIAQIGAAAIFGVSGTHYRVGTNTELLYVAAGGSDDWFKGEAGCKYAYTLELPDTGFFGFLLPARRILPIAEETWIGIKAALVAVSFK